MQSRRRKIGLILGALQCSLLMLGLVSGQAKPRARALGVPFDGVPAATASAGLLRERDAKICELLGRQAIASANHLVVGSMFHGRPKLR